MSIEAEMTVLKRLGFFACLPEQQLRALVFGAERMRLHEGHELYQKGDIADCAYIVLGGRVDLFQPVRRSLGADRRIKEYRQVVYAVKAGTLLGAFALISDKRRETGAYVAQRGDVLRINRTSFRRQLQQSADMRSRLYTYIFANFQSMTMRLENRARALASA
ncbi:MAG: cyclic nucleotide-binding domain-containing protein [Candidatus Tokpelaia sp.]|nr:MAG: cyclic nucleotide-binding domain-containing protein [Candidatus Tokpelaia sp.]KAA6206207.1 MAG: cyclic nucleotide-binding domain-containing protein [Candidatus Tokpelaia sp.]